MRRGAAIPGCSRLSRRLSRHTALLIVAGAAAYGQGRPLDWPFYGGDAQRSGWEKTDWRITRDNVKDFQLVLKRKLTDPAGQRSLSPPVVIGMLISYRGFKELAFVTGASDIWSIDADLDRVFWHKHFEGTPGTGACAGVVATPSLTPPVNFGARPRPPAGAAPAPARPGSLTAGRGMLGGPGFGSPRPAFAVSPDGKLHLLNTSNGEDVLPALNFLPAHAKASPLTMFNGTIYTTTSGSCGGAPNGVWAIDLSGSEPEVSSFAVKGGDVQGLGGLALGTNGTVYVQTSDALQALAPKDLKPKGSFAAKGTATPLVFAYKGKDMVVSAADGRLYLFAEDALAEPLDKTAPIGNVWGGLSSWQDADGVRWVLAPVWGHASAATPNGAIVAYKVEDHDGKPALTQAWISRDMSSPEPPVITSGVVFALSAANHATLYALDGATGKEIYSTGTQVSAPANLTGLTVANARVYFTTADGTLYAFGVFLER